MAFKNLKVLIDRPYRFFNTAHKWISEGGKTEDFEEAKRRIDICRGCEFNVRDSSGCLGCYSRKAIMHLFGYIDGRNKHHEGLIRANEFEKPEEIGYCDKCRCALKVKVFLPLSVVDNGSIEYPQHCWQNDDEKGDDDSGESDSEDS